MTVRYEWLESVLTGDVRTALTRLERAPDVRHIAVMPDVHLARDVCIGTVVATTNSLYPAAVGGDAGCGMRAVALDVQAERLRDERVAARVLAGLVQTVPILKCAKAAELPSELEPRRLSAPALRRLAAGTAGVQLGTLGRGNHFLELQADEAGQLWLMVHSGSRGIGTSIREWHESRARERGERVSGGLMRIAADSDGGQSYLADQAWALAFAALNRRWIEAAALGVLGDVLGARAVDGTGIECHHNFVRAEVHAGERLFVHRKGANSAQLGEIGIIPGSMGTCSYHVEGRGDPRSLSSSSHGAGRCMSRTEARQAVRVGDLNRQMRDVFFDRRQARRLVDESPSAYKDIDAVMRAQKDLVVIRRRLTPLLVHKGA